MPNFSNHSPNIRHGFFISLLLLVSAAFAGLIQPFIMAFFWAVVLAIVFRKSFRYLRFWLRGRTNLAAALTTAFIIAIVVIPSFLVLLALVKQGQGVVENIRSGEWNVAGIVDYYEGQAPRIEAFLQKVGITPERVSNDISTFVTKIANILADQALGYTQDAIALTAEFFLMLYLLFFFLRDGRTIVRTIVNVVPMGNSREYTLVNRFASVVRATLKGTVIVAIVQGGLGGLLFAILGIEGAFFWGVVMILLSFLPIGGSTLVWGPAAIYFLVQGPFWKGIVLIAVGSLVIGLVDNLLRPMLVGRDTQMPDYLILLATLGGIAWFGLSGFVLGPVIAALFITCWEMAGSSYGGKEN